LNRNVLHAEIALESFGCVETRGCVNGTPDAIKRDGDVTKSRKTRYRNKSESQSTFEPKACVGENQKSIAINI
jgi:hypothetical protein